MSRLLLDVNVLIALIDPTHEHHEIAHHWFFAEPGRSWLTCPITENGTARIISHPRYSNTQPVAVVMTSLESLTAVGRHERIPDDVSMLSPKVNRNNLLSSSQITDTYLALLAAEHGARLATLDRRLSTSALSGDASVLQISGETPLN